MAIVHPLVFRQQMFAAKAETTNGTAIALAAADAAFNTVGDVAILPDIPANERQSPGSMSNFPSVNGASGATVEVTTEFANSGSATLPLWFSVLLPAAGFGTALGVATVASGSASASTVTVGHYLDGLLFSATGVMLDLEATFESGKTIPCKWTGKGIWVAPSDVALLAPTYATGIPAKFQAATLTWNSLTLTVPRVVMKLSNDVQLREDGLSTSGYKSAVIVNRNPTFEIDIEAALVANLAIFGAHVSQTEAALSLAVGSGSNNVVTVAAPKLQLREAPKLNNKNGIAYYTCTFGCNKSAAAGDDELTITLA